MEVESQSHRCVLLGVRSELITKNFIKNVLISSHQKKKVEKQKILNPIKSPFTEMNIKIQNIYIVNFCVVCGRLKFEWLIKE